MKKLVAAAMIIMTALSFTNLFGINIAGIAVFVGVISFFINNAVVRPMFSSSGLDFKAIGSNLRDRGIWIWIILPLLMDVVAMILSKFLVPEYTSYIISRAAGFVSFDSSIPFLVVQLAVLALGEEIAWRAFFQKQLVKTLPIAAALAISSGLFALGHVASGSLTVVAYNVFFVFINSILYGIIFHKTNNAWISALSHFVANLFSIVILVLI